MVLFLYNKSLRDREFGVPGGHLRVTDLSKPLIRATAALVYNKISQASVAQRQRQPALTRRDEGSSPSGRTQ